MNDFVTEWYGEELLLNFTSNGIEFMGMFIMGDSTINYLYANDEDAANDYYNGLFYDRYPLTSNIITTGWWYDEGYQTIDLGPDPQPVSMEIYEWFVSNAKQEGYEYIKGTWLFNDEINLQGLDDVCYQQWMNNGEADDSWRFYIDFISNGMRFNYMATGDGTIATVPCPHGYEMLYGNDYDQVWSYAFNDGEGVDPFGNQHWWSNEAYKTIDFGTTYQRVPTEFYEWLLENAQPCLTGTYQFKDIVIMFYDAVSMSMNGNFVSNNTEFSSISIEQADGFPSHLIIKYGDVVIVDCNVHNQALEPSAHLPYTNSNYSKIDFGDNVVPVSLEFYKWIMKNTYME